MKLIKKLIRIYVEDLDSSIEFYQKLSNDKVGRRFKYSEANLEIASLGDFLLISGKEADLLPYKGTGATFLVDSIEEFKSFLEDQGAVILKGPQKVPTGRNMTVQHPDQTIVEYVEHNMIYS